MYFQFGPIIKKKMCEITAPQVINLFRFPNFLEGGSKLKIPTEIKPPVTLEKINEIVKGNQIK